jgi:hypothetical protein
VLLGFMRQFAPYVENGTKTHSIRKIRQGRNIQVGDRLDCYVDPRQKTMRLLGRFPCVKVEEIVIEWLAVKHGMTILISIDGRELAGDEAESFAWRDGFRKSRPASWNRNSSSSIGQMHDFWHQAYGHAAFPFFGHLIHWDYSRPVIVRKAEPEHTQFRNGRKF